MRTAMIKQFIINKVGTDYVVGDIHGCFSLLQAKLDEIGFDPTKDRLFSVGDLVDRGTESDKVLEWLSKHWFHAVCGNHEQMIIDAFNGGDNEIHQCAVNGGTWFFSQSPQEQQNIVKAFSRLPILIEVTTADGLVGIVHAEVEANNWAATKQALTTPGQFNDHTLERCIWGRTKIQRKDTTVVNGVNKVYCGHTPGYDVVVLGNQYYIDTWAVKTGNITVMKI